MDIRLDDGTVETVLVDDAEYLWAMEWVVMHGTGGVDLWLIEQNNRLKKAIYEYAEVGLMLDEILGTWR